MDIWKWAEEYFWCADYHDPHTGRIYACSEYKNDPALPGIPVYQDGALLGFVKEGNKFEEVTE